jgi:hypothetical protein
MNADQNTLSALIIGLVLMIAVCATIRACAIDAKRRGKSPVLVTLLVILLFPFGLVAWILFRPEPPDGGGGRRFRLTDHRLQ